MQSVRAMELALIVIGVASLPWRGNLHAAGAGMFAGMLVLVGGGHREMTTCCFFCSEHDVANPYLWKQAAVTLALGWAFVTWRRARPPALPALRRAMCVAVGLTLLAGVGSWDARGSSAMELCGIELWASALVVVCLVLERRLARPPLPPARIEG